MVHSSPVDISVLIRTSGRSLVFLHRALDSICAQTRLPAQIIVANDGADEDGVLAELAAANRSKLRAQQIQRDPQLRPNRAAALNRGIAVVNTPWIAFLDDDDTWAPTFLERVSEVIVEQQERPEFGGVVTQTGAVYERLEGNRLVETRREAFNPNLRALELSALAVETQFTNNALVIRKDVFAAVGGYREDLSIQEDWEFNVRAACRFHFEVIPEILAYYHLRPATDRATNTSAVELNRMAVMIRNEWLRADIAAGRLGLGQLALAGESVGLRRMVGRLEKWHARVRRWLGRAK